MRKKKPVAQKPWTLPGCNNSANIAKTDITKASTYGWGT